MLTADANIQSQYCFNSKTQTASFTATDNPASPNSFTPLNLVQILTADDKVSHLSLPNQKMCQPFTRESPSGKVHGFFKRWKSGFPISHRPTADRHLDIDRSMIFSTERKDTSSTIEL